MFKKLASEALGLSDIGKIVSPADYDKTDSDDYTLHEDGEKIFFLIKSKKDEYCFTNLALIHVDGESAISSKRTLKRYDYYKHEVSSVSIETAGTIDLDVELKFTIGSVVMSIDIDKKQLTQVTDIYKTLLAMEKIQHSNKRKRNHFAESLTVAKSVLDINRSGAINLAEEFKAIADFTNHWLNDSYHETTQVDFGELFLKYIHN